jgi:hypothetical protein
MDITYVPANELERTLKCLLDTLVVLVSLSSATSASVSAAGTDCTWIPKP